MNRFMFPLCSFSDASNPRSRLPYKDAFHQLSNTVGSLNGGLGIWCTKDKEGFRVNAKLVLILWKS